MSTELHEPPAPVGPTAPPPSVWRRVRGWIVAAALVVFKFGKAALLLLPKIKVLSTGGTMVVSIVAYSFIWGWRFAVGFVLLILIHEMGHVIALRREGIPASAPIFIPFLGAVIGARSLGGDAAAEARVGLAGPLLGSLGAAAVWGVGEATNSDLLIALAFTGFFLNLFNLIPVTPFDGGRAVAALSPWMWFVGLFGLALLLFVQPSPFILLFLLLGAFDVYRRWKEYRGGGAAVRAFYRVAPRTRAIVAVVYLGLIVALVLGMDATHLQRDFGDF